MNRFGARKKLSKYLQLAKLANRRGWSNQQLHDFAQQSLDRRRFLKGTLASSTLLTSGSALAWNTFSASKPLPDEEVVILGGGLAGLTAAYELWKVGIPSVIFEGKSSLGGRVQTKRYFNEDGMFIELGAEFVDTIHTDLVALCSELGLAVDDYVDHSLGLEAEVFYFGGEVIDPDHFIGEFRKLAAMIEEDTREFWRGGEFVLPLKGEAGPNPHLDQISLAEYLLEKEQQGIDPQFIKLIDIMYLGMYGLETSKQNVFNFLALVDTKSEDLAIYGDSDESKRIRGGNGKLVEALSRLLTLTRRTHIELENRLVRIRDLGTSFALDFETPAGSKTVKARQLICTLPFSTLRDVEGIEGLNLSPAKKSAIYELGYATNTKLTLGYQQRIWRKGHAKIPANYGTVWSDGAVKEIRDSSNGQAGERGIVLNYLSGDQGRVIKPNLVNETLNHLEDLYPGSRLLFDGHKNLKHWVSDPFAQGSYLCQTVGHYRKMGGFERQDELEGRLIFAGSHLSKDYGGYMNGAIETGKKAAAKVKLTRS